MDPKLIPTILPNANKAAEPAKAKPEAKTSALLADERALLDHSKSSSTKSFAEQMHNKDAAARNSGELAQKENSSSVAKNKTIRKDDALTPTSVKARESLDTAENTQAELAKKAAQPKAKDPNVKVSKREVLDTVKRMLGKNDEITSKNPLLAFVSGRLEKIEPDTIPDLVANNDFLNAAMAQEDSAAFLDQTMPIRDLLELMGISSDVISQIKSLNFSLEETFTPRELLKAIGIDPSRVVAELNLLKNNIQLEGLNSYMQRAEKLRLQDGVSPKAGLSQLNPTQALPSTPGTKAILKTGEHVILKPLGDEDYSTPSPMDESLTSPAFAQTNHQQTVPPQGMQANPIAQPSMASNPQAYRTAPNPASSMHTQSAQSSLAKPESSSVSMGEMSSLFQDMQVAVPGERGFDPFSAMENQLSKVDSQTVAFSESPKASSVPMSSLSLEEVLMTRGMQMAPQGVAPMGITDPNAALSGAINPMNLGAQATVTDASLKDQKIDGSDVEAIDLNLIDIEGAKLDPNQINVKMNADQVQNHVSQATLTPAAIKMSALEGGLFKDNASGQSEGDAFGATGGETESISQGLGLGRETSVLTKFHVGEKVQVEAALPPKIVEKAQMLVKQGGGSIVMDLGTPDTGKLEVALNVVHDRIEIKIMAGSEHLRDLITQELPKLRESLSQQNLNLKEVQVGVGGGSAWQHDFANGGHAQGQSFQQFEQRSNDHRQSFSDSSRSVMRSITPWQKPQHTAVHSGQIQVWA